MGGTIDVGVRTAFKLLERACVGLRRAYGGIEKGSLVLEEYTYGLKRIRYDGWEMHTWGQEEQTRTEKGILGIRRALKLQEMAHVERHMGVLRRAHCWLRRAHVD